MVERSAGRKAQIGDEVVLDPVTGKPLVDSKINPLVIGSEVEAEELESATSDPPDEISTNPDRSRRGVQLIAHVEDPDDISEMLPMARAAWRKARKDLGLD